MKHTNELGKRVMEKVAAKTADKGKVSHYLSKNVYAEFKRKCGLVPASVVLEELMREFNATSPEPKAYTAGGKK